MVKQLALNIQADQKIVKEKMATAGQRSGVF